jgi:hypothetical protein
MGDAQEVRTTVVAAERVTPCCPLGARCESCGVDFDGLRVVVLNVLGSAFCLTMCRRCASSGRAPQIMLSTAGRLVEQHLRHVAGQTTNGR